MLCGQPGAPAFSGRAAAGKDFDLSAIAVDTLVSGGAGGEVTVGDSVYLRTAGAVIDRSWRLLTTEPVTFESLDEGIAEVDQSGFVSRVSDGTARIRVHGRRALKELSLAVLRTDDTVDEWLRFDDGTLAQHMTEQTWGRVEGVTPGVTKQMYLSGTTTRNPTCWALNGEAPIDNSCICKGPRNGTAITPRAVIHAWHYEYTVGQTVTFVGMNGSVFTTTIAGRWKGDDDIAVATLVDELPEYIVPAKLMPADFRDYLPTVHGTVFDGVPVGVPICKTDQQSKLLTDELFLAGFGITTGVDLFGYYRKPETLPFWESSESGDSGSGVFGIVDNSLVVLSSLTGPYAGVNYAAFLDNIQSILTAHDGGTLQTVDLSAFPNFGE